jgi:hypothetical protein
MKAALSEVYRAEARRQARRIRSLEDKLFALSNHPAVRRYQVMRELLTKDLEQSRALALMVGTEQILEWRKT